MLIPSPYSGPVFIKDSPGLSPCLEGTWAQGLEAKYKIMVPTKRCLESLPHYIFLTEHHVGPTFLQDREINQAVICKFYKNRHHILLERPSGTELQAANQPETSSVPAYARISGWDEKKSVEAFECFQQEIHENYEIVESAVVGKQIETEQLKKSLEKIGNLIADKDLAKRFLDNPNQRQELFESTESKIRVCFERILEENATARTLSLIENLKKYREHEVIFVVLGSSHIFLKESDTHFPQWAFEQIKSVEKYLQDCNESFVILKPRKQACQDENV